MKTKTDTAPKERPVKVEWEELLEKLAELEHWQWRVWTKYFLNNLSDENIGRWVSQISTPYSMLTEKEKESDRKWARKVIKLIKSIKSK